MPPSLIGNGSCIGRSGREEPGVGVELALEVDRALVEEGAKDVMRLAQPSDRLHPLQPNAVLLQHREVPGREDELGPAVGELVERGDLLRDDGRILEDHVRDLGSHPESGGTARGGRKERPHVLVVRLVGAVAAPEPELVHELDGRERLLQGLLGDQLVAEAHSRSSHELARNSIARDGGPRPCPKVSPQ
jgi:hypothetical protein